MKNHNFAMFETYMKMNKHKKKMRWNSYVLDNMSTNDAENRCKYTYDVV